MRNGQNNILIQTSQSLNDNKYQKTGKDDNNKAKEQKQNLHNIPSHIEKRRRSINIDQNGSTFQVEDNLVQHKIKGTHFESFVQNILNFKLGIFSHSNNKLIISKIFLKSGVSQLLPCVYYTQPISKHNGYQCDECLQYPIRGQRYHCQQCQSFDLCKKCYQKRSHHHRQFKIFSKPKNQLTKQTLRLATNQLNSRVLKSSIR